VIHSFIDSTISPELPGRRSAEERAMFFADLDDARRHHAALLEIIIHHPGGWAGRASLSRVLELCRAATGAVDDGECAQHIGTVIKYAAELFSEQVHQKWDRGNISGADFLRLEIVSALHSFGRRLSALEALRRGGEEPPPGKRWNGSLR
jgi:hypothetical protein